MTFIREIKGYEEQRAIKGKWIFLLLLIAFIPQSLYTWKIIENSIMTDFYSRHIGSRLLLQNKSPYFSIGLFDHNENSFNPVNGVTATPLALLLQVPLAKMDYCNAKIIWGIIEELCLFAATFFTCLYPKKLIKQVITIFVTLIFFCYSRNWWAHTASGQYYVVFGLIFSLTTYYYKRFIRLPLLLFPVVALLRPFFALATLPFLFKKIKANARWIFTGISCSLIILLISGTYKLLPDYNRAMNVYASEITGWAKINTKISAIDNGIPVNCVQQNYGFENFRAASLFSLQHYLKLFKISLSSPMVFTLLLLLFLCATLIPIRKTILASTENLLIASFLVFMFSELFTPANRNPYNIIQYIGIVGLVINKTSYPVLIFMIVGLAFNHEFPITFPYQRELGEAIFLCGIYLTLISKKDEKLIFPSPINY